MSLFKILKGDSSRISMDITPFHDGWCYYTRDDGRFYIDSSDDDGSNPKRTCINPNNGSSSRAVNHILTSDGWLDGKQALLIDGLLAGQNGFIGIDQGVTDEQLEAAQNAELAVDNQADGTLTISCLGDVPQVDIPVVVVLLATIMPA